MYARGRVEHRSYANTQSRNRRRALCYNDPTAEWPALALALDVSLMLRGGPAERRVNVADFRAGP